MFSPDPHKHSACRLIDGPATAASAATGARGDVLLQDEIFIVLGSCELVTSDTTIGTTGAG